MNQPSSNDKGSWQSIGVQGFRSAIQTQNPSHRKIFNLASVVQIVTPLGYQYP